MKKHGPVSGMELAGRLRLLIEKLGMERKELAEHLNTTVSSLSYYLNGRIPPAEVMVRLALLCRDRGIEVDREWLLWGEVSLPESEALRRERVGEFWVWLARVERDEVFKLAVMLPGLTDGQLRIIRKAIDAWREEEGKGESEE